MKSVLAQLQIRPGESAKATPLTLLMLIVSAGGAIASPGVEAMFFTRFGVEFLPFMYMALAAVTVLSSLVITTLFSRLPKLRLYRWMPLAMGTVLIAERVLVAQDLTWFFPVLWLSTYLTWTLQYLVIWGLAGTIFDTRQAKRLFPLFAAGGILGSAMGGLITRPLVPLVGSENLLLAWAVAFFIAAILIRRLSADLQVQPGRLHREPASIVEDLQRGYQFVRRSELMRWMSAGSLLLGLLLFAVLFPFSKAVADTFASEDEIAGFLGVFQGATTVIAFLISLLLANRLFARVGFMGALLAFPLIYLAGFASIAAFPIFAAFAALRFMQLVWRLGVADTAFQAVFNLVPAEWREPTRAFIDGIPRQVGVGLAGLLLVLSERALQPLHMFLLGAVVSATGVYVMWRARKAYRGALTQALRIGQPHVFFSEEQPFGGFQHDASAVSVAVKGVSDPDPAIRRVSAEILGNLRVPEASQALVDALDDPDPDVRSALIGSLARAQATPALLEIAAHLHDPEPEVRLAAAQAMRDLAGYPAGLRAQIEPLLDDPAPEVRSCVAVVMLQTGPHSSATRALHQMKSSEEPRTRVVVLEALAGWGDAIGLEIAMSCLDDRHASVRRAAAVTLARCGKESGLPHLASLLGDQDRSVREIAAQELARFGGIALRPAIEALQDPKTELGALVALQHMPIQAPEPQLREYAEEKRSRALGYDDLWRVLRESEKPESSLELLTQSLRSAGKHHANLAIRAVGVMLGSTSISVALESIESDERSQRANALEILDSLGDREVVTPLLQIWDDSEGDPATLADTIACVERALSDDDAWIRACAALAAGSFKDTQFANQLDALRGSDRDPLVRETAARSLDGGLYMKALSTLSIMERILFLRRVPLFAELPPSELKQVAAIAYEHVFSEDELIAREGEPGDEMYIIVDGEVRVLTGLEAGKPEELARRGPGEYVGEMSIISHEPRMASLRAAGDVRMLCIGQKEFEGIIRERPETGLAVMRELIARLKEAQGGEKGEG